MRIFSSIPRSLAALPLLASLSLAPAARAQGTDDRSQGTALFEEGRRLMAAGNYAAACPKLQASQRLILGVGTTVNLAECFEKIHRLASAYTEYQRAAALARDKGQTDKATYAEEHAKSLEARVARLIVEVPKEAWIEGLEVRRAGTLLLQEVWGTPVPVDEGRYLIEARAPDHAARTIEVDVRGEGAVVRVAFPPLLPTSVPPHSAATVRDAGRPARHTGRALSTPGFIVGGVGAASLLVSGITGAVALGKQAGERGCSSTDHGLLCSPDGYEKQSDARSLAWASTATMIAGGALVATGLVLVLTSPRPPAERAGLATSQLRIAPAGLAWEGRF